MGSTLLPVLFGAALGNLLRGLPIDSDGNFSLALFTDFTARPPVGILDWYTLLAGVFGLLAIGGHGATFLAWKTDGDGARRAAGGRASGSTVPWHVLWPLMTAVTWFVNAGSACRAMPGRPLAWLSVLVALGGLVSRRPRPSPSAGPPGVPRIVCLSGRHAGGDGRVRVPGDAAMVDGDGHSLTAYNASVPVASLRTAFAWWIIGFPLAVGYFVALFRIHRGKAVAASAREGY